MCLFPPKVLKLYAWEKSFQQKVTDIRSEELTTLRKTAYLIAVTMFIWTCAPYIVSYCSQIFKTSYKHVMLCCNKGYFTPNLEIFKVNYLHRNLFLEFKSI